MRWAGTMMMMTLLERPPLCLILHSEHGPEFAFRRDNRRHWDLLDGKLVRVGYHERLETQFECYDTTEACLQRPRY